MAGPKAELCQVLMLRESGAGTGTDVGEVFGPCLSGGNLWRERHGSCVPYLPLGDAGGRHARQNGVLLSKLVSQEMTQRTSYYATE